MRLGIIGDIHGDIGSLKKAISFLQEKKCKIICLGDLVSEDSEENEACVATIKELGIDTVIGQHDDTCVKVNSPSVSCDAREFLKTLPATIAYGDSFFVHDNPLENAREGIGMWRQGSYIRTDIESGAVFENLPESLSHFRFFFVGHTHVPKIFSSEGGETAFRYGEPIGLTDGRYIINPGRIGGVDRYSVGATCAIFDTDITILTIERI